MKRINYLFWFSLLLLSACSTTRNLPEGEGLYTGATLSLHADSATRRERKVLREDLEDMTRPEPNSRFLGIPFKLMIWNMFSTKNPDSFFGRLREKWGEPPVLASELDLELNQKILGSYLENKGFFDAAVSADSTWRRRKVTAHYIAEAGPRYLIDSVAFPNDSSDLSQYIQSSKSNTLLKPGEPFDLDIIKGERLRIEDYLKERGFYYFSPDYLLLQADSTAEGGHRVDMRMTVKPDAPPEARDIYKINDVFIYSDYSLNTATIDTNMAHAQYFEGYYVVDANNKFKPKMFRQAMQFEPGDVYNITDHNRTLNRLINMNVFKFVKNRFEPVPSVDTPKLDVYYYLTPFPKQSVRAELGAITRSNNLNGSELRIGYHNRNLFRGGEQFDFRIFTGTDVQFSGAFQGYNTYRLGGEMEFGFPRFLVPFYNFNTHSAFMPKTNIQLSYELLNRRKLYNLNSFRGAWGYVWKESQQKAHEYYPAAITYVLPANISDTFRNDLAKNPSMRHITDTQFVLGSTYQFTLNQNAGGVQKINSFYFNGLADVSGNVAGLITTPTGPRNEKMLFGLPFAQYLKFDLDGRYYRKVGLNDTWANRISVGIGLPYGNSQQLPYVKQFFTGGSSSNRAFRARTVGPGTYLATKTDAGYIPDQTGDIRLEMSTEYRPKISGPLYGALFIDASNIWLKNEDPDRPGAAFSKDFLKELAVGAGVGLRMDIQVFVIRFDVAFPIRKPWLDPGNRWVLNNIKPLEPEWRRDNIVYNLAIGYPF
ncbi:MAG: BamA/TamA family outer membrane protein [Flavisolibacter sp.]